MRFKINDTIIEVYAESRSRRMLVGTLRWNRDSDQFEFTYDKDYLRSPKAIAVGPELLLSKRHHVNKGKLFPSFQDRIPSKSNAAYADYCAAAGISPRERNPIILLGAIGKRGPSAFIFEPLWIDTFDPRAELAKFREHYKVSHHELALALGLNRITLQRLEGKKSSDAGTLRLLSIFFTSSDALKSQLKVTGRLVNRHTISALQDFASSNQEQSGRPLN